MTLPSVRRIGTPIRDEHDRATLRNQTSQRFEHISLVRPPAVPEQHGRTKTGTVATVDVERLTACPVDDASFYENTH
jgi:hypothetical protein